MDDRWWGLAFVLSLPAVIVPGCGDFEFGSEPEPDPEDTASGSTGSGPAPDGSSTAPADPTEEPPGTSSSPTTTGEDPGSTGGPDPGSSGGDDDVYCPMADPPADPPEVCLELVDTYVNCYQLPEECVDSYLAYCDSYLAELEDLYGHACRTAIEDFYACMLNPDCRRLDGEPRCESELDEAINACG